MPLNLKVHRITSGILDVTEKLDLSLSVRGEVREDQNTVAECSVTYYCSTSPPVFTWNHQGWITVQHTHNDTQWVATSTLRFLPSRKDNNKHLRCSITYKGRQQEATSLLGVTCKYVSAFNLGKDRYGNTFFSCYSCPCDT